MGIHDVYPNDLIEKVAEELKKIDAIKAPEWTKFVKTGVHRERAPAEEDWWYKRAAAVLRTVCVMGPIGVSKLRTKYGGKKRRGHKPPQFRKGSGSIIRKVLQQLDKAGFTKFAEKGVHKGRIITKEGKLFLKKIADSIGKVKKEETMPVEEPKKEVEIVKKKEIAEVPKKEIQEVKKEPKKEVKEEEKPETKQTEIKKISDVSSQKQIEEK
ncbi:30S ribosomal protein S19e [Candidatus Woesearchaeota archaeon]|nr:30S ribosomal protein S19e [Candidatus Woesearchaeota archaeon]